MKKKYIIKFGYLWKLELTTYLYEFLALEFM